MVGQIQHVQHFTAQTLLLEDQRHGVDAVGIGEITARVGTPRSRRFSA